MLFFPYNDALLLPPRAHAMNRYPLWRYLLILAIFIVGLVYSAPNLFAPDPAVQITGQSSALEIDQALMDRVRTALAREGVAYFGDEFSATDAMIRLHSPEDQLRARE